MSPPRDIGQPTGRDVWASLTFDAAPAGVLVARLAVEQPDGWLVELVMSADAFTRLLAGEVVTATHETGEPDPPTARESPAEDVTDDVIEDVVLDEDAGDPEPPAAPVYGTALDHPPAGTAPIARSTDVATGETVVAYVRGRWQPAVVVRRDIGSLLVTYSRPGSFGPVQLRIGTRFVRKGP